MYAVTVRIGGADPLPGREIARLSTAMEAVRKQQRIEHWRVGAGEGGIEAVLFVLARDRDHACRKAIEIVNSAGPYIVTSCTGEVADALAARALRNSTAWW